MKILKKIGQIVVFPFLFLGVPLLGFILSLCIKALGEESEDLGSSAIFLENFILQDEKLWRLKMRRR